MQKLVDIQGETFGRLTCVERAGRDKRGRSLWLCECICGNKKVIAQNSLKTGGTKSCGCLQREVAVLEGKSRTTHGLAKSGLTSSGVYKSWSHMKQRCLNENNQDYHNYGGRGIKVCKEWMDFESFHEWAKNNGFEAGLTIDRINVNGDYKPSNCRWATKSIQNNNKRNTRIIVFNGQEKTLNEWAEILGVNYMTLSSRLYSGWSIERTLNTPVRNRKKN